jgi:hypothetical protein
MTMSEEFRFSVDTFEHVLGHISKAAGKIHGLVGDADHIGELRSGITREDAFRSAETANGKPAAVYIADLIICARELARICPSGTVDIEDAVAKRMADKKNYLEQYAPQSA